MHACNTSTTKKDLAMSYYDNDYSDDMYDRYMHTGEGAEYFEDYQEDEPCGIVDCRSLEEQLDDLIDELEQKKKELEKRAKEAEKKKTQKQEPPMPAHSKKSSSSGCLVFMLAILFACIMLAL